MKLSGIRKKVFLDRYSIKGKKGLPIEKEPEEMWRRVAKAASTVEKKKDKKKVEKQFYEALSGFRYVPGGRVLAGAGTGYDVSFYNCFVLPSPKDSREGILETLSQMVEIMAHGGGVGMNMSSLRPRGARVKKVNGFSSGPINWAQLFSVATKDIIQQGGCFAGNTKIMTNLGLMPIKDVVERKKKWFVATHSGYRRITASFSNGTKKIYRVKTKAGYSVELTMEHKLLTVDTGGKFYLKKLADFYEGEKVIMLIGDWLDGIPYVSLNTDIPEPSKYSYGRKRVSLPCELNEDLAFLLGVYDADGSKVPDKYSKNGKGLRISIANNRKGDIKKITKTIEKIFKVKAVVGSGDGEVSIITVFGRQINEFLALNGLLKEHSSNVTVPSQIFSSPKQVVEAYIAGVFLGDGTNRGGKGGFRIVTVSKKFASQIQLLLLNLGAAAKIQKRTRRHKNWRDIYTLTINGHRFMKRFYSIVSPYTEKAGDNPISVRNGSFNWPFNLVERFMYVSGIQRTIARINPTTSHKTTLFLQERQSDIRPQDRSDLELLTSCVPDTIESIDYKGKEAVFDLEVQDIHLLSGNGFYTSNSRRGALMIMLWDWHPDIEEFITVKQNLTRINGANLSVCVSDLFMEAVMKDKDWDLVYPDLDDPEYDQKWNGDINAWKKMGKKVIVNKTIKARKIWKLIADAAWRSAEPGIVFMERCNKLYNNWYWNKVDCVNPCGEEPLPGWGVCNLGSINLSAFVKSEDIDKKGSFDYPLLKKTVKVAVRLQDNLIDLDPYIFEEIREIQLEGERRLGIGTMGLGDALIKMHLRYGSKESIPVISKIYKTIRDTAYKTSVELAIERGPFPKFDSKHYPKGEFIKRLPQGLQKRIKKYGIRNSLLLMQAPTGTTSLLAETTSGIEPVFEFEFIRQSRIGKDVIRHPLYDAWCKKHEKEIQEGKKKRPNWFVSANDLTPEEHIAVQGIIQYHVDASISKTVNAPNQHTVEDVMRLYTLAYKKGCKGITYMREGSRQGVLERKPERKKETKQKIHAYIVKPRPMIVKGSTYKVKTPMGSAFITINTNGNEEPLEVFINVGKAGSDLSAMAEGLGRTISLALRFSSHMPTKMRVKEIIDQLSHIGGSRAFGFGKNRIRSLPDAIAKVLSIHYGFTTGDSKTEPNGQVAKKGPISNGQTNAEEGVAKTTQESLLSSHAIKTAENPYFDICPECGGATLVHEEGCKKCYSCGFSEC